MAKIFVNDSIVYIQDEIKIDDIIKNIYEDVNNRQRIKAALKDYHFDHMIQDDKSMAVRKLRNGKDIEHLHISADKLHDNHVKFLEFLKNLHTEEAQSTEVQHKAKECIPTVEAIEKVSTLKKIINENQAPCLYWGNGDVYYTNKSVNTYVRAFKDQNFDLLKDMIDVYLDVKTNQQNNIFSVEEIEKLQKLDDLINSYDAWYSGWLSGFVYDSDKNDSRYVRAFEDKDFSLLKKILKVCLVRYNMQAITSNSQVRPDDEAQFVKSLKDAMDSNFDWCLHNDGGHVEAEDCFITTTPHGTNLLMQEFINLYLQAHGNENN